MIRMDHVSLYSPTDRSRLLLNDVNCTFDKGDITLVVGQTGSGKTTLLNALAGLIPLSAGSITYDGLSLWNGKRLNEAVNLIISMAFQYPERQLFAERISKEFNYSLRPYRLSREQIVSRSQEALEQMRLPAAIMEDSILTLSDGLKRKVALATTFATKPEWLLLDEPTAGIDPAGIPVLLDALGVYKRSRNAGVIIASHDLDTFLPIADRVLILRHGAIAVACTPQELYADPALLLRTHVGLPASMQISLVLEERGLGITGTPLSPAETAEAIMRMVRQPVEERRGGESWRVKPPVRVLDDERAGTVDSGSRAEPMPHGESSHPAEPMEALESRHPAEPPGSDVRDESAAVPYTWNPISAWLFYMLLSAGILLQDQWWGIAAAAVATLLIIKLSGVSFVRAIRPAKPFLYFIFLSVVISGLRLDFPADIVSYMPSRIYFSVSSAELTSRQLVRFLLVMVAGVLFARTISQRMMQLGLEQALSVLHRCKLPVSVFTFSASLMLRFIPMLAMEIERMSIITKARGKSRAKHGSFRVREVHVFLIPLILSMLQHAEDLAIALEARGYKLKSHIIRAPLPYRMRDFKLMAAGIALFGLLAGIDYLN
jgi:energy-coupling factor transporter ATP-binding protein EcfA2/energy-coupling factor transporter transmembrane protein EcfT